MQFREHEPMLNAEVTGAIGAARAEAALRGRARIAELVADAPEHSGWVALPLLSWRPPTQSPRTTSLQGSFTGPIRILNGSLPLRLMCGAVSWSYDRPLLIGGRHDWTR
jgi:hypothetical protein